MNLAFLLLLLSSSSLAMPMTLQGPEAQQQHNNTSSLARCSSPSGSMEAAILVEAEEGEVSDFTTVQWQIGLGDTLCYRFMSSQNNKGNKELKGFIQVQFLSVKSVHSISNSYYFRLAKAEANCRCDCPGGANACDAYTDSCEGRDNCVNFYSDSVGSSGCLLSFLKLSASVCCSIQINPVDDRRFRAVELSVPTIVANFQVTHRDKDFTIMDSRTYSIDLNSGTTVDWQVSLQLSSSGPSAWVPPGWYVVSSSNEGDNSDVPKLLGNVPVNGLDEWNLNKLGWLKSRRTRDHIDRGHQLRQAFFPAVTDCGKNSYGAEMSSARTVSSMFPFVDSVQVWRRHAEITHRESPLLVLTLQHRNKVDVVMKFDDDGNLGDFEGVLYVDSSSNQFLNITATEVRGTLMGTVSGYNTTQSIKLSTGSELRPVLHRRLKVTGLTCMEGEALVSLHPQGKLASRMERRFKCVEESGLSEFREVEDNRLILVNRDEKECFACGSAWAHWVSPFNWGESEWSSARIGIYLIMALVCCTVIGCGVKLACCCCYCRNPCCN